MGVLILEKALAKMFGSYARIQGGNCAVAFRALTGERKTSVWSRTERVWKEMKLARGGVHFEGIVGAEQAKVDDDFFTMLEHFNQSSYLMGASMEEVHGHEHE